MNLVSLNENFNPTLNNFEIWLIVHGLGRELVITTLTNWDEQCSHPYAKSART